jgi:mono/diheme cytochrome c family protein
MDRLLHHLAGKTLPCAAVLSAALMLWLWSSAGAAVLAADSEAGKQIARQHCTRCHVVGDMNKYGGIGSTPSFGAIKTMADWKERFEVFFSLPPHPAVVTVEGVTEDRPEGLPAFVKPITLSVDEVENLLAFIDQLPAAKF